MSDIDDTNSIKNKGDLLNKNSDSPNTGQVSEDNNIAIKDSPEKADDLGGSSLIMAEASSKKILEDSNNESIDKKIDTAEDETTEKSKVTDEGSGDCSSSSKERTKEVSDSVTEQEKSLENIGESSKTNIPNVKQVEKQTKNVTNTMSDDEINEDDLTLRWDDDDGNESSDNHTESPNTKNNDVAIEDPAILNKEPKSPDNKLDATETETEIEMPVVKEVTSSKSNSEMTAEEKDAEAILEEKLLEDDDVETTKMSATVELNEEDLLKDDVVEHSDAMDIDTFDKNIDEVPEIVEKSLETADNKKQEHPLKKYESKSLVEAEKQVDSDKSNIGEQDKHLDNVDSVSQNIKKENIENNSNCNNNDNSQEENQMDVDNSINISLGSSPLQIRTNHGLHKPDVMLEIPTQELIDIDDVLDSPDVSKIDDHAVNGSKFDDNNGNNSKLDMVNDNSKKEVEVKDGKGEEIVESPKEGIREIDEVNVEKDTSEAHVEPIVSIPSIAEAQPTTSTAQAQPSTSMASNQMIPDTSGEVPNVSDSLGLLAESHRVVDDDEEQDDDEDPDDDDDSDLDEDSNDQHSETERTREEQEKESEDNAEEREDIINKCEEDFEYTLNDVGTEEQTDDTDKIRTFKREVLSTEEIQTEEINQQEVNNAEVEPINVKNEEVKTENIKYEEIISEVVKSENVKSEKVKTEKVKTEKVKSEEVKREDLKREIATAKVENTEPLLPEIKHVAAQDVKVKDETESSAESKVKLEKTDAEMSERSKKFAARKATLAKRFTELPVMSPSSATSNDDVIVQIEEIETVKLSDDEDEEVPPPLKNQVDVKDQPAPEEATEDQDKPAEEQQSKTESEKPSPKTSPSKLRELTISSVQSSSILNFVELEESSSEDDLQETKTVSQLRKLLVSETTQRKSPATPPVEDSDVTSVNIPTGIEIMSTSAAGNTSEIVVKEGEVVISGVPKPPPHKPARLNTSEVTIKTASPSEQTLYIPEINEQGQTETKSKPKLSLEIFSLDSDEEDTPPAPSELPEPEEVKKRTRRCINYMCDSGASVFLAADNATAAYYDASRKRRPMVCQRCAAAVRDRQQRLIEGIKDMTPLLQLDMTSISQDLVEILDTDSEDEDPQPQPDSKDAIGEEAAEFLEKHLADCLNKTWKMHNLDDRLKDTQDELSDEIQKLENASKEINDLLNECQRATDRLRTELYATFEQRIHEIPPILIYETPEFNYIGPEVDNAVPITIIDSPNRLSVKRRMASDNDIPAKRPAIPLGYAPLEDSKQKAQDLKAIELKSSLDDDKDISVVKLSVEAAPADLPATGELSRPPLWVGMSVFAMKNAFGPWFTGKITEIMPKTSTSVYTTCRVKFDHKAKNNCKILPGRCIAYAEPADVRLTIGTRVVALFKDSNNKKESFYSGIVAEVPNPVNSYRYLVFFDDGYAQYVTHPNTRLVCESSAMVWEEVHPNSREFVREYLMAYPERPMVRLHEGQFLKTEWDNKWWSSRVLKVDASLAHVVFTGDGRREWVYRGSTRLAPLYLELQAAERHRPRPMPRSKHARSDMPYVEYTRSDEQPSVKQDQPAGQMTAQQQNEEKIRRQRAVARKSTALPPAPAPPAAAGTLDTVTSRVVYYTPKNAEKPFKLVQHKCSPKCKREKALSLKDLRTYNPLAKPLLSGWERQIVRYKGQREVMYRSPCGRRLRNMQELHRYLRMTESELPVDLFDFYHGTHCLAEFVLNKCLVGKKDLSHGKENVPVPCVNYYDDSLPEFCSYNTERTPTAGVPLNLDPEFLCGCDCTDDCQDKTKCACWKMTLEGARTIGMDDSKVGYEFKRLPEPLPSGIYECNSRCKCKETCLNRVAQHPLQLKLQVFKTLNRGWGIRALNDVPKGAFLCVYAGNLLTDATANLDGLNEGDEYLAELDYIEVVEQMKEGYEEDIPEADKRMTKKDTANAEGSGEESSSSEEDENASKTDKEDDDFRPGYIGLGVMEFNKRLRRRNKMKKDEMEALEKNKENKDKEKENETNPEDDCITISDDEEIREPSRFAAQPGMGGNDFISKYKSVRVLFGEDEACYIMDAKVQGNIGRYLNHSCSPNVFVQNVFVDTHDPRFPWVAFFALSHIKAGTELTWNYNYDVGSVPGKVLYCYCEAPNCRGRLL